jgi:hypothetical protein
MINAKPIIAYNNKVAGATLSVSSEATGYPKENVRDWRTYTRWKGVQENSESNIIQDQKDEYHTFGRPLGSYKTGQTFQLSDTSVITKIKARLKKLGAPSDRVKCAIYSTTGSPPLPDTLLVSSDDEISPTDSFMEYTFNFSHELTAGTYALVLYRTGDLDDNNCYQTRIKDGNPYEDGNLVDESVTGWGYSSSHDLYFKIEFATASEWLKIDAGDGNTFTVKCLAISGHDLYTQNAENIALQWSDDDSSWMNCHAPFTPSNDNTIFKTFTESAHRYFRLLIPSCYTAPPQIGVLFIGSYFSFPTYPEPGFDPDGQEKEFEGQWSREGHLLGMISKYTRREIFVRLQRLNPDFLANTFIPFWQNHVPSPFFWAWDTTNHPGEVYLVALAKGRLSMPYTANTRSLELNLVGVKE